MGIKYSNYLRQGAYVFASVCLLVYFSRDYAKTTQLTSSRLGGGIGPGPGKNQLNRRVNAD